jgi:predicted ABC-type ATPase
MPDTASLISEISESKPLAIIVAGHNGSGKSTFWYSKLADELKLPLINADRLMLSILPEREGEPPILKKWASQLRDNDIRWQKLTQAAVQAVLAKVAEQKMPFAYETVFSHYRERADGTIESKIDQIRDFQKAGYAVALIFVGLASSDLSITRVETRKQQGGHDVPLQKLKDRFPRTQSAIRDASQVADLTLMFDNSRGLKDAFTLARAQSRSKLIYDCRQTKK